MIFRAIPHKERTAKRSGKRYNKEVKKKLTMSLISDELGQASTKKKEFLGIMEKLIPWSQWVGIVQPHYYKGERGNKPYDLELMLRIYVLQHLYNLADDAARNEIIDSRAFSQFCGVDSSNQVPDGDTIGRFRHILERNQLGEAFFTNVVESLQKCNLMLKKGTIVDLIPDRMSFIVDKNCIILLFCTQIPAITISILLRSLKKQMTMSLISDELGGRHQRRKAA